jgi:two-component system catabolic regulation response regulator CreB
VSSRILIVEDEEAIAATLAFALKSEGLESIHVTLGRDALRIVQNEVVDLAILDVGLPDTSGFELCKAIRKLSDVPVLFLTARADEIDRVVGLEIGGDDYVAKPFSPREVVARVKVILKRARPNHAAVRQEASGHARWFTIDNDRATVCFFSTPLELTKSEYLILKGLLGTPQRVYSRSEIMAFISTDQVLSSLERTVDAHIKSIRTKLREINASCDAIETHRGLGYSIRNEVR